MEPNPTVATVSQESDLIGTRLLDPVSLDDRYSRNVAPGLEVTLGSCSPIYLDKGPELPSMPFRLPYGGPGRGVAVGILNDPANTGRSVDQLVLDGDRETRKRGLEDSVQTPRKRVRASAGA